MLECVVNLSEGRDRALVGRLAAAGGRCVLDVHSDPDHNRSVLTICGPPEDVEEAARAVTAAAVAAIDLRNHAGVHPRIGSVDVVPFVSLARRSGRLYDGPVELARTARDRFAAWAATTLDLPCFVYGPERSLPELRREAWTGLRPDTGPDLAHPTAGATAVGARPVLVAYNLWLAPAPGVDLVMARRVAASARRPGLRTLGLAVGDHLQVSCNLVDPWHLGPGAAHDAVAACLGADAPGASIERAELVGLVPAAVLDAEAAHRWDELGLAPGDTIEARLEQAGLDGGRF